MNNKIKMYVFNDYQQFTDKCVSKIVDRTLGKANKTASYYFYMSKESEMPKFFVLVDEEKNPF